MLQSHDSSQRPPPACSEDFFNEVQTPRPLHKRTGSKGSVEKLGNERRIFGVMSPVQVQTQSPVRDWGTSFGAEPNIFGLKAMLTSSPGYAPQRPSSPPLAQHGTNHMKRTSSMHSLPSTISMVSSSEGHEDGVSEAGLILHLCAGDYSGGPSWVNRARSRYPDAVVPKGIRCDDQETALVFSEGGDVISVPLATSMMPEVSFAVWVKVLSPFPAGNLAWILTQAPDYNWSRALVLNDFRLGYVSITTSKYWDSQLGRAPVGSWIHVAGVWRKGGGCSAYLNGVCGAIGEANTGRGSHPQECLVIGGRQSADTSHNAAVAIAEVRAYSRALTDAEVAQLSRQSPGGGIDILAPPVGHDLPQLSPHWDDQAQLFWFPSGIFLHDLPDGHQWQREFQGFQHQAFERSKPSSDIAPRRRVLQAHASDSGEPLSLVSTRSRRLVQHPSDPDKLAGRAAHTTALQQMPRKSGMVVHVNNTAIALFRFGDRVHAVSAACPHQGASLVDGEIGDIEDMVEGRRCYVTCPVHKFQFDLSSGVVLQGRKCAPLPTYVARSVQTDGSAKSRMVEVGFESLATNFFSHSDGEDF